MYIGIIKKAFLNLAAIAILQAKLCCNSVILLLHRREMKGERGKHTAELKAENFSARVARGRRLWHAPMRAYASFSLCLPAVSSIHVTPGERYIPRIAPFSR